jgi:hypothetical protein
MSTATAPTPVQFDLAICKDPLITALGIRSWGGLPTVVYPPGVVVKEDGTPENGKRPMGKGWGESVPDEFTIRNRFKRFPNASVGMAWGPGRGPNGTWPGDIECDGPEGPESLAKLMGGPLPESLGWRSARGPHLILLFDPERMAPLVKIGEDRKGERGVIHAPKLPGLEIRAGREGCQIQSVVPPSLTDTGLPREWNGVWQIAWAPDAFYENLATILRNKPRTGGKIAKGRDPWEITGVSPAATWFQEALKGEADKVAKALDGSRHRTLLAAARTLGGQIHHGFFSRSDVAAALEAAARDCKLPVEEAAEAIQDGLAYGEAEPLPWPDQLDRPGGAGNSTRVTTGCVGKPIDPDAPVPDFFESDGWLFRCEQAEIKGRTFRKDIRIAKFTARIVEEVERHEQDSVRRQYRIAARDREGRNATALVDAVEFESMAWVHEQLGAAWYIDPGRATKDQVRAAIQHFSREEEIPKSVVYTFTGWIERDGRPLYLHAGGAVGAEGPTDTVKVEFASSLARHRLPDPPTEPGALRRAVESCLNLLTLAKADRPGARGAAAVLCTLPWRTVLGPTDYVAHFSGGSGDLKSSTARLALDHFAAGLGDPKHKLLASWNATLNSLQRYAHDAKDNLLGIDEMTGEKAVAIATEFIQAQGNLKARDRMNRQLRLAPNLDPRCGVLSTGEADPTRLSTLGRMIIVRFSRRTIDPATLSKCQADAAAGLYAEAMAAFVRWLATDDRIAEARAEHPRAVQKILAAMQAALEGKGAHRRHAGIAADLVAGYRVFLRFAVEQGAIEAGTAEFTEQAVTGYLADLIAEQGETQQEQQPGARFLAMLRAGLRSLKFHLIRTDSDDAPTKFAEACGWHKGWLYAGNEQKQYLDWKIPPNSQCVGYIDEEDLVIHLEPELAKVVATTMARQQGETFEHVANIGRDLADAGLIVTKIEDGKTRYTIHKRVRNAGKNRYFRIPISNLFGAAEEETDASVPTVPTIENRVGTMFQDASAY